ncbi:hypothetical protein EMPG_11083 [Blastomyces silverae]|uniref:Aminoglycoside phosphotransferase domain-containing protein n=1 Tax=Blastomyces silverae TaxID=2060906 RepID=A0A0H1B874_9EURO|nr:hypothetical protein EMPG_11083 [Blastomyces silverae]
MNTLPVPPHVLRSFNLPIQSSNTAQLLPSGQGNSILLPNSNVVLKHIQDATEAEHAATVQHQLYNLQKRRALQGEMRREYQVAEPLAITTTTAAAAAAAPSASPTINESENDGGAGTQRFVADDTWTAARVIPGTPDPGPGRWEEILRASRALHRDLRALYGGEGRLGELAPFLPFLRQRQDRWAKGDRIAWEMEEAGENADVDIDNDIGIGIDARANSAGESGIVEEAYRDIFRQLVSLREPIEMGVSQLVHGDLAGNVLFTNHARKHAVGDNNERGDDQEEEKQEQEEQEEHVPSIIDFSLYFRPVEFAEAIIVADGLLWYDAGDELVRLVGVDKYRMQMLVRALIFRLVASSEGERERGVVDEAERNRYQRAVGIVRELIGA